MPEEVGRQPTTGHQPQLDAPQDRLNERIGVLTRREAEARILAPLIEALGREFGRERVIEIVRAEIVEIARRQGRALAEAMGGDSRISWPNPCTPGQKGDAQGGDALEIEVLERSEGRVRLQCHAPSIRRFLPGVGLGGVGLRLSCNRDFALDRGLQRRD